HSAFQGHAAHIARWPAMLSPNGSSATCIADGVFHIPMPCFHGALPVYPKVLLHFSIMLHGAAQRRGTRPAYPQETGIAHLKDMPHVVHVAPACPRAGLSGLCTGKVGDVGPREQRGPAPQSDTVAAEPLGRAGTERRPADEGRRRSGRRARPCNRAPT